MIIEVAVPPQQVVLFQSILCGEDGLAVMRCRDPQGKKQQLWTTRAMLPEAYAWLDALPASLQIEVVGEFEWHAEGESDVEH